MVGPLYMVAVNSNVVLAKEVERASSFVTEPWRSHDFTNIVVGQPLKLAQVQGKEHRSHFSMARV